MIKAIATLRNFKPSDGNHFALDWDAFLIADGTEAQNTLNVNPNSDTMNTDIKADVASELGILSTEVILFNSPV